ncbi:MAG: type II toxin-antitoxin system VapB family antitoxin [Pseudonocardiales bacterium]|nr:type II toxin-antitoxin system VapB family antitoxin [Pseudonocardiales bacterium]
MEPTVTPEILGPPIGRTIRRHLLAEAAKIAGTTTKKSTVETALREFIRRHKVRRVLELWVTSTGRATCRRCAAVASSDLGCGRLQCLDRGPWRPVRR